MDADHSLPSAARPSVAARALAMCVLVAGLAACAICLAHGPWDAQQAPAPYAWRDVAVVHLLCALPLAWFLAGCIHRTAPAGWVLAVAVVALAIGLVPLLSAVRTDLTSALRGLPPLGLILRAAPVLGLAIWAALVTAILIGGPRRGDHRPGWRHLAATGGLALMVALVAPWIYVCARCRHDAVLLGDYVDQARFGEAQTLARGLLVLDAPREIRGHALADVAQRLERVVGELEARVAVPLPDHAPAGQRLDRARDLASLGRTDAALDVLQTLSEPSAMPHAANLRGAIHETRGEWLTGLQEYERAQLAWRRQPPSPDRAPGLLQATKGIAYCQRKLGRYADAEASYQQVLDLAPTADSHFLLAQFYEDAQQTEKARVHARQAMALAPTRYGYEGERLINKLTVFHFGCLGVFSAEHQRSGASFKSNGAGP